MSNRVLENTRMPFWVCMWLVISLIYFINFLHILPFLLIKPSLRPFHHILCGHLKGSPTHQWVL